MSWATQRQQSPDVSRRVIGVLTFPLVIVLNGLAGSGALSGESIGAIANRYPSAFLPASYVFSIWGVIYLGLLGLTLDVAFRPARDADLHRRLGSLWPMNGLLNVAWIVAFSFGRFWVAMTIMLALLANLIAIHLRIGDPRRLGLRDRLTIALPFNLYLSWISVAVISNAFQLATVVEWSGFGIDSALWSIVMMTVATALGAFMALQRGVQVFPLVVAWALAGIAVRYSDTQLLAVPAWALAGVGGIVFLYAGVNMGGGLVAGTRQAKRLMRIPVRGLTLTGVAAATLAGAAAAQISPLEVELEGGPAWQSYNDVEIPNDGTATRFSLSDLAGAGPWAAGRLYVTWNLSERHGVRLMLAPFSLTETGVASGPLSFAGASYAASAPLEATYKFNSYRLSYRWRFHSGERTTAWFGLTAKVRDASIRLVQGSTASRKDDVGFVPLLHLAADWRPTAHWRVSFDADALAGGPGRAVDASLKLGYDFHDRWSIRAGYRTLEGGADVDPVYSFAWLHYAVASVVWRW